MLHPELPGARMKLAETEGWVEKAKTEGWYEPNDTIDAVLPFPNRELEGFEDLTWLAKHLPFADGHFDLTYCVATLHHALDLPLMVAEMARVTKQGGGAAGLTRERGARSGAARIRRRTARRRSGSTSTSTPSGPTSPPLHGRGSSFGGSSVPKDGPPEPWGGTLSKIPKVGMTLGTLAHITAAEYGSVSIFARKRG